MKPPLRIAVLECDSPLPNTQARFGSYGNLFRSLLKAGASAAGLDADKDLQVSAFPIHLEPDKYPELEDIDAIMMTGSKYNSFDNDPWILKLVEFVTKILEQRRIRIIGVCFGHQIIGRALGARVGRSKDRWEAAVHQIDLTDLGKRVFGQQTMYLQQMHRDIVDGYPEGVESLGSSPICANQGMFAAKRLISVQAHPEFDEDIMLELLEVRRGTHIFTEEEYARFLPLAGLHADGVVVSKAFIEFLLED